MGYVPLYGHAVVLSAGLLLAACGGGTDIGGFETPTAEGVFKDANVVGLNYRSGDQEDVTGADGSFTYEVGRDVTFFLGGLAVGTAPGQTVVTPIDLIPNGSVDSLAVQNIVRLLLWLDENNTPTDGIQITPGIRDLAESTPTIWVPVNFNVSENDFYGVLSLVLQNVNNFRGARDLPTSAEARDHLTSTLRCVRSGAFRGTLTSGDAGHFGVMIDSVTGELRGYALRNGSSSMIELDGIDPVSLDQEAFFTSSGTGATFTGRLLDEDSLTGQWQHTIPSPASGTYQGTRLGGAENAVFRFTASYTGAGDAAGIYTFDINAADSVAGIAYDVSDDDFTTLSGSLSGNTLTASSTDLVDITATVNLVTGTLSGGDTLSHTITGSGCRLN